MRPTDAFRLIDPDTAVFWLCVLALVVALAI